MMAVHFNGAGMCIGRRVVSHDISSLAEYRRGDLMSRYALGMWMVLQSILRLLCAGLGGWERGVESGLVWCCSGSFVERAFVAGK